MTGHWLPIDAPGERCRAFVPAPLPPDPSIVWSPGLQDRLSRADQEVGRLDGLATLLPDPTLFLYSHIRREALLSSQIEGTQSSLSDLLLFENEAAPGAPLEDVREVSRHVAAVDHGLARLREGFPLCLRLLREMHGVLLAGGRGGDKEPGEFRRSQNWIGGTRPGNARFVPPPADHLGECLGDLEKFLHPTGERLPILVRAALVHVQFETIHPFLDGNGRIGRLLITLMLCAEGTLSQPLLHLSLHFKQHRDRYYQLLQAVRTTGDWELWLEFFLEGVGQTAAAATRTARRLLAVAEEDVRRIEGLGRTAPNVLRLHRLLQSRLLMGVPTAASELHLSFPTVDRAFGQLVRLGIARELTGRARGRLFAYDACLQILNEGTEPLAPDA